MHIYNWHHSNVTGIHYVHEHRLQYIWRNPLCFLSPLADCFLLPFLVPSTYLETLLAVTGSVHLGLRLLVNWPPLPQPFPNPSPLQIPRTQVIKRPTMTTSRIRLLLSGTVSLFVFVVVFMFIFMFMFHFMFTFVFTVGKVCIGMCN